MNAYQIPADPTAVMGRRVVAYLIDFVIILAVAFLATALFADFKSEEVPEGLDNPCDIIEANTDASNCFEIGDTVYYNEGGSAVVTWLLPLAATIANSVIIAGVAGGSLGKLAMGLRVVNKSTGRIAGIGPNLVRTLLWIVDGFPYCFPLVGLITGFATKGHRRVGDMAAGTLVVGKASLDQPPVVPGLTAPAMAGAAGYAPPPGWDAGGTPPPPATWGAPVPPPPADPWAPPAAPGAPNPPADQWAPPADPWAAPPPPAPAPAAPEPTATYEAPAAAETVSYEPPVREPEPERATFEPLAEEPLAAERPAAEPVAYEPPAPPAEPEPAPAPEPEPAPAPAPAEPSAPAAAGVGASGAGETPGVGAPMWDAARNAYIQWDPALNAWMQWDDAGQQWRPIS